MGTEAQCESALPVDHNGMALHITGSVCERV